MMGKEHMHGVHVCVCCHWGGVGWDYLEMNLFSGRPFSLFVAAGLP